MNEEITNQLIGVIALTAKKLKAMEVDLKKLSDQVAEESKQIAEESTNIDLDPALDGQNEKANENWPTVKNAAERVDLSRSLFSVAKFIASKVEKNGQLSSEDRIKVGKALLFIAKNN